MSCCYKYSSNPYFVSVSSNNNLRCFARPAAISGVLTKTSAISSVFTSSDFISFQRYTSSLCNKGGPCPRCFGDYPNQSNSSSYTTALKANLIYPAKFSTCNCINLGRKV
uniref:Uncharacterized protein n=1 Tax=viral metagenome TaxID=1070528 RepID=A0A6C0BAA7_9ZZZZ